MSDASKPHSEQDAAFRSWAMADDNPVATWVIERREARRLVEQYEGSITRESGLALTEDAKRWARAYKKARDELAELKEQLEALRKVARDLYDDAGVDDIDQRLDYLVLQVTRDVWNDFVDRITDSNPASLPPDEGTPSHSGSEAVTTGVHHGRSSRRGLEGVA